MFVNIKLFIISYCTVQLSTWVHAILVSNTIHYTDILIIPEVNCLHIVVYNNTTICRKITDIWYQKLIIFVCLTIVMSFLFLIPAIFF